MPSALLRFPSSRIPLPRTGVPPRHLYRHLLREAGYLPAICATYMSARITLQFRNHRYDKGHAATRITNGVRKLRHLQAANTGHATYLHAVFLHTFGRTGPLRRTLLAQLVLPDAPADSEPPAERKNNDKRMDKAMRLYERARTDTRHNKHLVDRWDFNKMQTYLQSQAEHSKEVTAGVWIRDRVSKSNPTAGIGIPEKNVWGRELPLRELRTQLKTWWKRNINKVMPPLGEGEWQTLRGLATSSEPGELLKVAPRRPVAAPIHQDRAPAEKDWDWRAYATLPITAIEREREAGFGESIHGYRYDPVSGPERRLSDCKRRRKVRRAAAKVFQASSYIKRDESTAKTEIIWGHLTPDFPVMGPGCTSFFEGLDENGTTPRPPGKKSQSPKAKAKEISLEA